MRILRIVAVVAVACVALTSCIGSEGLSERPQPTATASPFPGAVPFPSEKGLPTPVAPQALPGSSPAQRAERAVEAFGKASEDRASTLVASLALSGVPTLGVDGQPLAGSGQDQVGLPWWHVAEAAIANPALGLSLRDVTATLDQPLPRNIPGRGRGSEAVAILQELRNALMAGNERVAFFASFLRATSLRLGGVDLARADAQPQDVLLDGPAIEVFVGRALRSMVLHEWARGHIARPGSTGSPQAGNAPEQTHASKRPAASAAFGAAARAALSSSQDYRVGATQTVSDTDIEFAEGCDSDGADGWALWVLSKVTGGIGAGGFEFDGLWATVLNKAAESGEISRLMRDRGMAGAEVGGYLGTLLTVITAIDAIMKLKADVKLEPREPLERNKLVSDGDGKTGTLVVSISMEFNHPEEDVETQRAMNCIAQALSVIGNNSLFAATGPLKGVQVEVEGARGFADRLITAGSLVLFGPERVLLRGQTDKETGEFRVPVQGRQQPRDIPATAKPVERTASITVAAASAPVTAGSLARTLLDSILCGAKPGRGCDNAIADVLQAFTWRLGEFTFTVRDWEPRRHFEIRSTLTNGKLTTRGDNTSEVTGSTTLIGELECLPPTGPQDPRGWVCNGSGIADGSGTYYQYKQPHDATTVCIGPWRQDDVNWGFSAITRSSELSKIGPFTLEDHTGAAADVCDLHDYASDAGLSISSEIEVPDPGATTTSEFTFFGGAATLSLTGID
jgi:hypothetical protein